MKKIFSLIIICLLITGCGNKLYETIDTNRALELIDSGSTIIDVREVNEYNDGHITGAINIPLSEIDTIDIDKSTTLIVYCVSGVRSKEAVEKLAKMGYTSLYNLDGGLLNWGGSLEK